MFLRSFYIAMFALLATACAQETGSVGAAPQAAAAKPGAEAEVVADAEQGKRLFIYCQACHSVNEGGMNKVGPNLYGFMGQKAGAAAGFVYSEALQSAGITWDNETLDQWIQRPSGLVEGTTMVFAGIQDPQQRADLIAYLREATGVK